MSNQDTRDLRSAGFKYNNRQPQYHISALPAMSPTEETASKESSEVTSSKELSQETSSSATSKPPSIIYGPSAPEPLFMTFGELLNYHAEVRPDKPAVISHVQDKTISFKDLRLRSLQLATALSADGVGKGDLVAISLGSRIEYFEVLPLSLRVGCGGHLHFRRRSLHVHI